MSRKHMKTEEFNRIKVEDTKIIDIARWLSNVSQF